MHSFLPLSEISLGEKADKSTSGLIWIRVNSPYHLSVIALESAINSSYNSLFFQGHLGHISS